MPINIADLPPALQVIAGLSEEELQRVLAVGFQRVKRDTVVALLDQARQTSHAALAAAQDAIDARRREVLGPLEAALAEQRQAHASVLARLEAIRAEAEAGADVDVEAARVLLTELEG